MAVTQAVQLQIVPSFCSMRCLRHCQRYNLTWGKLPNKDITVSIISLSVQRRSLLWQSNTQCIGSASLFRFGDTSVLDEGSLKRSLVFVKCALSRYCTLKCALSNLKCVHVINSVWGIWLVEGHVSSTECM